MNGRMKKYKDSLKNTPFTVMPEELHRIRIDYKGLLALADSKGVSPDELSDEEKNIFILNSDMNRIRELRACAVAQ